MTESRRDLRNEFIFILTRAGFAVRFFVTGVKVTFLLDIVFLVLDGCVEDVTTFFVLSSVAARVPEIRFSLSLEAGFLRVLLLPMLAVVVEKDLSEKGLVFAFAKDGCEADGFRTMEDLCEISDDFEVIPREVVPPLFLAAFCVDRVGMLSSTSASRCLPIPIGILCCHYRLRCLIQLIGVLLVVVDLPL